jgi:hypothetical protein
MNRELTPEELSDKKRWSEIRKLEPIARRWCFGGWFCRADEPCAHHEARERLAELGYYPSNL